MIEKIYSPKRLSTFNGLHGVISQKIELFITTAVITSDLTDFYKLFLLVFSGISFIFLPFFILAPSFLRFLFVSFVLCLPLFLLLCVSLSRFLPSRYQATAEQVDLEEML
jgi:hypothetical protein